MDQDINDDDDDDIKKILGKIPFKLASLIRLEYLTEKVIFISAYDEKVVIKTPCYFQDIYEIAQRANLTKIEVLAPMIAFIKDNKSYDFKVDVDCSTNSIKSKSGALLICLSLVFVFFILREVNFKFALMYYAMIFFSLCAINAIYVQFKKFIDISSYLRGDKLLNYPVRVSFDSNGIEYTEKTQVNFILWDDISFVKDAFYYITIITVCGKKVDFFGFSSLVLNIVLEKVGFERCKKWVWVGPMTPVYYLVYKEMGGIWMRRKT